MKESGIKALFKSKSTVFSPRELALIWGIDNHDYLKTRVHYYLKKGYLHRLCHGLYVKDKQDFDLLEAANKLRAPSYVSLETVLAREGVIFQKYSSVFLVSYASKIVRIYAGDFVYKRIKDVVLFNTSCIINTGTCLIASKERAFLDAVYLYKNYHFDNLRPIQWDTVEELAPIYKSAVLEKRVGEYKKDAKS